MPPRPTKRARPSSPSPSPDPLGIDEEVNDEPSASHLVSFLTGYADHHSSGSSSGDEGDHDGFDIPSEEEGDPDDVDIDGEDEEDDLEGTPTKRAKMGLIGTSTPSKRATPRKRKAGSRTPGGTTPGRKTPSKRKLDPLELINGNEDGEGEGIIRISKSDKYFQHQSRTSRTSGNSYSLLAKPLSQAQYDKYTNLSSSAREKIRQPEYFGDRGYYDQWEVELDNGFNLFFYGFGSKRKSINRFVQDRLSRKGNLVIINGHFPQLNIRDVLNSIEDNLSVPQNIKLSNSLLNNSTTLERSAHRIYSYFLPPESIPSSMKKDYPTASKDLYLIIHNLDSPSLRKPSSLAILSLLAASPRIHILASFDHLHTPLLFSPSLNNTPPHTYGVGGWNGNIPTERGFNWLYHNMTTYAPYSLELSYLRLSASSHLSLSSSSTGISEEGALQILKSVPPMAARLLKLLLTRQLSNLPSDSVHHTAYPANQVSPIFAVDNDILQSLAKEKFIAREEERYDALIGEYRDHGLVVEAGLDGEGRTGRWVWVPLGKAAIERVLETMKEVEV